MVGMFFDENLHVFIRTVSMFFRIFFDEIGMFVSETPVHALRKLAEVSFKNLDNFEYLACYPLMVV